MSAPLVKTESATVVAVVLGADANTVVGVAPFAGTVTAVDYYPGAAITGAATNNRTFNLYNRGQAGAGTTVVATLNMASGVNAAAYDNKAIVLSATAANLVVAAGDALEWESLHVGTGIADPGGRVVVSLARA